ncbi:YfhO family protein [Lutibacter sp.]|uniref:YfhO family protein n=1 Tax=Lutibacter sp. TaxID=1925666 RepID=UPI0027370D61|nr:YfhO family protein [Lutibacter sp.]MDP3314219.1 YfhO family protein [Lutibacter sp.]
MNKIILTIKPFLIAFVIFVGVSMAYFAPLLEGKKILQSDITQFIGMAKEVQDFRAENDSEPYWTNSAFGGMPTYNLSALYPNNYIKKLDNILRFLPRPADYLFLYFLSFFVLLLVLNVDYKLAILGALSFGLSTYLVIILGVGHNAKAHAIAYMPLVLAGILLVLQHKYLWGFVLTAIAMGLEINTGHPQMTYYLGFTVLVLGIVFLIEAIKEKELLNFFKRIGVLIVAMVLAVGINATSLLATNEYVSSSTRGESELTINPDGTQKGISKGLDKEYITEYSYGISETFNLFIPRFMGGGNYENIGTDSNIYNFLKDKTEIYQAKQFAEFAPMYWGMQPIVEAPAYVGAILLFLFLLGIFLVSGKLKNWLVATVIISILLSWGKNLNFLTDFFINYVPLYNKFRAVSSIQVLAELAIPLLGILAIKEFFNEKISQEFKLKSLKYTIYVVGGLALMFTVVGTGLFTFEGLRDQQYDDLLPGLLDAIIADRKALFFADSLRTFVLVGLTSAILWLSLKNTISKNITIYSIAVLILFDLVVVNKRYVNSNDFVMASKVDKPYIASEVDKEILQDKSIYRVANFNKDIMTDGGTSYFHKSIGGYHAAKLKIYQELFDYQIAKNNIEMLHMLNVKYLIFADENQREMAQINPDANGNAWFISNLKIVKDANEEIFALDSLNTKIEAVIASNNIPKNVSRTYEMDSTRSISLDIYKPNSLTYSYNSSKDQFVIFSEIYYKNGWNAYIDGVLTPYYKVNYVLRGMPIGSGKHTVEFKFEPEIIKTGRTITLVSYLFLILIPVGWFFTKRKNPNL